jgi:hypothetical protein
MEEKAMKSAPAGVLCVFTILLWAFSAVAGQNGFRQEDFYVRPKVEPKTNLLRGSKVPLSLVIFAIVKMQNRLASPDNVQWDSQRSSERWRCES